MIELRPHLIFIRLYRMVSWMKESEREDGGTKKREREINFRVIVKFNLSVVYHF